MSVKSTPACLALLLFAALQFGCEETDDALNTEVAVAVVAPTDPDLRLASLDDPGIQALEWTIVKADLGVGDQLYDLTAREGCEFVGSAVLLPASPNKCGAGVVVGQAETPLASSLALEFRLTARRAQPLPLPPQGDEDVDGVVNDSDGCRLIADPGQEDDDMNGIGDACQGVDPFTGEAAIDNDGDLVVDRFDNCVYIRNFDQQDTFPFDGIGNACDGNVTQGAPLPQEADVAIAMNTDLQLGLDPGNFSLAGRATVFATVDLSSGSALTCDWNAGICQLDPAAVTACYLPSRQTLITGCF